jgi:signal transduction histidine kinase
MYRILEISPTCAPTFPLPRNAVHADDFSILDSVVRRAREGQNFDVELRLLARGAAIKHVRLVGHPIDGRSKELIFVGAVMDLTERKHSEKALNEARAEVARLSRAIALSALSASITHEIRQPLCGILNNAHTSIRMLAAEPPNVEGAAEMVRRTIRAVNRADDIISRLQTLFAKKTPTIEPVDLNDTVLEVIALSSGELRKNRVVLQSHFAKDLPAVNGDRIQLQQVILNLILNALDAMAGINDRPKTLLVETALGHPDGVRLSVRDTGVGLGSNAIEKLFDAFYTTKPHGMGVGLSLSRSIIEGHRGRLWATANDGPGATFTFCIPCAAEFQAGLDADVAI